MEHLPLYWRFIRINIKAKTEYRAAFLLTFLSRGVLWSTEFALLWVLLYQFKSIAGWGQYEVMFLYSLNLTSYSLAAFFCFHPFTKLPAKIQSGEFDELLTKPLNPMLYLMSREFTASYFSNVTFGLLFMGVCMYKLQLALSVWDYLLLAVVLIGGTLIQASAFIYTAVPSFWMVRNNSLINLFMNDFKSFIRYPISIYPASIQVMLTLIVPYAFINFYPAQYFLNKSDFLLFHPSFQYLTIVVGGIMFTGACLLWKFGIKHYHSTGS
ncbi:ABC-2 family transporter protein [Paenibacillus sp. GSMTC-2017]|uniref:ABC transporter permease n=1 Tax=Paenibacillus sp. GSMTC-2017 TaxID=2794350 RepID=UPI0018D91D72|nr:ABC-2 family transporter protein [Paenibacillus sp. GSMTC-2017]MBH5319682.1 ABC-2 family transporter protein [Paenibacillus sp. GSMTC-2017]